MPSSKLPSDTSRTTHVSSLLLQAYQMIRNDKPMGAANRSRTNAPPNHPLRESYSMLKWLENLRLAAGGISDTNLGCADGGAMPSPREGMVVDCSPLLRLLVGWNGGKGFPPA